MLSSPGTDSANEGCCYCVEGCRGVASRSDEGRGSEDAMVCLKYAAAALVPPLARLSHRPECVHFQVIKSAFVVFFVIALKC